jgi:hypothetical protein
VSSGNVVPINPDVQTSAFKPPVHFTKRQTDAWKDLVETTEASLHVKQNRFTFEMAAMLLAKMRAGKSMTATESKQLKQYMIALGLATNDDDQGAHKPKKNGKYFDPPAG